MQSTHLASTCSVDCDRTASEPRSAVDCAFRHTKCSFWRPCGVLLHPVASASLPHKLKDLPLPVPVNLPVHVNHVIQIPVHVVLLPLLCVNVHSAACSQISMGHCPSIFDERPAFYIFV